jgi:glycosyltransferase involved in cell wall biosynthesis
MAITELDVGGAERAFVQIAIGLKSRGWDVNVISLRDAGVLAEPLRQAGISVEALHCGGPVDFRAIGRLKHALLKNPPAVLLTFLHQANIVGRLAAKRANVKNVICGVRVADRRWSVRIPEMLTKHLVTHYVAVSKSVAKIHCDICAIASLNMTSIYNGVDLIAIDAAVAVPRREINCNDNDQVILCVGRLTQQKSPLDVVEAFDKLRQRDPTGHQHRKLVFVGDGPLKPSLLASIQKRQLERHVHILGWRSDVASVMKAATVLVVASKWEGLPNVVLEAQAARLPVIASAVDGCQEIIHDGVTGRLIPPGNTEQLADVLLELIGRDAESIAPAQDLRMLLARNARADVESRFSWTKCVAEYDALLRNLKSTESVLPPFKSQCL